MNKNLLKLFFVTTICLPFGYGADISTEPSVSTETSLEAPDIYGFEVDTVRNKIVWKEGEKEFLVSSMNGDAPFLETEIGAVLSVRRFLEHEGAFEDFSKLISVAAKNGIVSSKGDAYSFSYSFLTGARLRKGDIFIVKEGILEKRDVEEAEYDRSKLIDGIKAVQSKFDKTEIDSIAKKPFNYILDIVKNKENSEFIDDIYPEYARRMVRGGWLSKVWKDKSLYKDYEKAVIEADLFVPAIEYKGNNVFLGLFKNSFDKKTWRFKSNSKNIISVRPAVPSINNYAEDILSKSWVIIDLDINASVDSFSSSQVCSAKLVFGKIVLASWSKEDGFSSDEKKWKKYCNKRKGKDAVIGRFPPHIALSNAFGDTVALITKHGVLDAPKDNSTEKESEKSLSDIARLLPSVNYLDLFGNYMFNYVHDSPDPKVLFLPGNKESKGDIHQTAYQTLATTVGGQSRGDCDDLAELYQNVTEKQGKTSIVVSLPGHAAMAYAEKQEDEWHVFLMQTGPSYEFIDEELPKALEKCYLHFGANDTFDQNAVGLLLRFSGENTRSSWRLSYRIFSEPEYAKVMIDVQRDWHFQTYQRAIHKMLILLENGDTDTATYRELAGLYQFTGQYDLAAQYQKKSIETTKETISRLLITNEYIGDLFTAGRYDDAKKEIENLMSELPDVKEKFGRSFSGYMLSLSGVLIRHEQGELALELYNKYLTGNIGKMVNSFAAYISDKFDPVRWGGAHGPRRMMTRNMSNIISIINLLPKEELSTNKELFKSIKSLQVWIMSVAAYEIEEPSDADSHYAILGNYYKGIMGEEEFYKKINAATFPNKDINHKERLYGNLQEQKDFSWIKTSISFWYREVTDSIDSLKSKPDNEKVIELCKKLLAAYENTKKLDLLSSGSLDFVHYTKVILAMFSEDEQMLRELLKTVKDKDDKYLRDYTAQWMGDSARNTSIKWFRKAMQIWKEELDYKPKYYWIAWRAALNHAPKHALIMAEIAAKEFSDDKTFVEEYEFMKELLLDK